MKNKIKLPDIEKLPKSESGFLRWYWFFLSPYKWMFFACFFSRIAKYVVIGLIPFFIGEMISIFESGAVFNNHWLFWNNLLIMFSALGFVSLDYIYMYHRTVLQRQAGATLTLFSLNYMTKLPMSWHKENATGGKIQRVMTVRSEIKNLTSFFNYDFAESLALCIGTIVSLFLVDAPFYFSIIMIVFAITYLSISWAFVLRQKKKQILRENQLERLASKVYEFLASVSILKAFNLHKYVSKKSHDGENKMIYTTSKIAKIIAFKWFVLYIYDYAVFIALLISLFYTVINGDLPVSVFATVVLAFRSLSGAISSFADMQPDYFSYKINFLRIKKILCEKTENLDFEPFQKLNKNWKKITFDSVFFHYPDDKGKTNVLKNFNLTINRNEKIGIVGTSGSGKSTVINLLMKQMLVSSGKITIDNKDLLNIKQSEWLAEIGLVPQDVSLFNLSLRENILMGNLATATKLDKYLKLSYCKNFIEKLPNGIDTVLGERAIKISGGQKQRIGIARALAKESEIMIFDEATSALDSKSEKYIQDAIDNSFGDKTLLVIAHRLSTLKNMDRIIVMNGGRVAESGTHRQLIAKRGIYYKMWNVQNEKKKMNKLDIQKACDNINT